MYQDGGYGMRAVVCLSLHHHHPLPGARSCSVMREEREREGGGHGGCIKVEDME